MAAPAAMANTAMIIRSAANDRKNCLLENPRTLATARSIRPVRIDTKEWTVKVSSTAIPMAAMLKMVRPSQPPPARGLRSANAAVASPSLTVISPGAASAICKITWLRSASSSRANHISLGSSEILLGRRRAYSWKSVRSTIKNGLRSGISVGKWVVIPTNLTGTTKLPNSTRTC